MELLVARPPWPKSYQGVVLSEGAFRLAGNSFRTENQKNPRAHTHKIGTSPPPPPQKKTQNITKANLQKNDTNKYYYTILGFSICSVTLGKPFARVCFEQIFCTDFLHGCFCMEIFAWIFCTDFLHGFFARIFCTDLLHGFLPDLSARISARIACQNCLYRCCTDFCTDFLGASQNTCWEAPKFHRENPPKNSPCFGGLLGRGSGGRRVR